MTENEMRRMQEEALRRTQEMQRRAQAVRFASGEAPAQAQRRPSEDEAPPSQEPETDAHDETVSQEVSAVTAGSGDTHNRINNSPAAPMTGGIFEALFRDKEKTLILGLILLLMDEKTDNALLMALMYLLI